MGFIEYLPDSAKRDIGAPRASSIQLKDWCQMQMGLLETQDLTDVERHILGNRLPEFRVDPSSYTRIPIFLEPTKLQLSTLSQLVALICSDGVSIYTEKDTNQYAEERDLISVSDFPRIADIFGIMRTFDVKYPRELHNSADEPSYTLRSCIERELAASKLKLSLSETDLTIKTTRFGLPIVSTHLKATRV